jgi:rod shape-determining protein MreB
VGGGTTDIAVVAMGGIVVSESVKIAGDKFDQAVMQYVRRQYNLLIGERTAEAIKIQIGAVYDHGEAKTISVKGRDLASGMPRVITLSSKEMMEAMIEPVTAILDSVCAIIERTPPDLLGDILKNGIYMAGGGSLLYGLDKLITRVTGIKTTVAKNPVSCVAMGTGKYLSTIPKFRDSIGALTRDADSKPNTKK